MAAERCPQWTPPPVAAAPSCARARLGRRRARAVRAPAGTSFFNIVEMLLSKKLGSKSRSMLVGRRAAEVDGREQREDVGLEERPEDAQGVHRHRDEDGD